MANISSNGTIFPSPYDSQSLPTSVKMHRRIFGSTNRKKSGVGIIQVISNAALDTNGFSELVFGSRTICSESACQKAPKNVGVAVQNCHKVASGAYTGEIRVMKNDFRQQQGLFSRRLERRNVFVEKDEVIAEQVTHALAEGCVCEHLEDREAEKTSDVVFRQVKYIADKVSDWSKVVIAYEPVWAIGTGKTASPEQAREVHEQLCQRLKDNVADDVAASTRIIYGGSVTRELANETDVDVFLVGGKKHFIKYVC